MTTMKIELNDSNFEKLQRFSAFPQNLDYISIYMLECSTSECMTSEIS